MRQDETGDRPGLVSLKVQSADQRRGSRGRRKLPVLSVAPERGHGNTHCSSFFRL